MNTRVNYLLSVATCMAVLAGCNDDNGQNTDDKSLAEMLVGTWEGSYTLSYPAGIAEALGGTFVFEDDNSYHLEYWEYRSAVGTTYGYSLGNYALVSDSLLILDPIEYEDEWINLWDTLHVVITDTMFISNFIYTWDPLFLFYPISWLKQ